MTDRRGASPSYDAVVLAGGTARRMAGQDKTRLVVDGATLLDRVLGAVGSARQVVVVGPSRPTRQPVSWVREEPPGGGPAAALAAALPVLTGPVVVLLAADLPLVTAATVDRLVAAVGSSGVVAVDAQGRKQWLLSAWPLAVLRQAALVPGGSLRAALDPLHPAGLADLDATELLDCDTPADLERARRPL